MSISRDSCKAAYLCQIPICIFDDKPLILVIAGDARLIGEASLFNKILLDI